jgi:hypothetical protein
VVPNLDSIIGPPTIRIELPPMRRAAAALLLLCAACAGQVPAPIPDSEVPQRKEILRNHRVTVNNSGSIGLARCQRACCRQHLQAAGSPDPGPVSRACAGVVATLCLTLRSHI